MVLKNLVFCYDAIERIEVIINEIINENKPLIISPTYYC